MRKQEKCLPSSECRLRSKQEDNMAKKSMLEREKKRELCARKFAAKRQALKEAGDYEALSKLPRNASPTRLHNRCKLTGRPHGYMRKFGICRNQFRDLAYRGEIPGIRKASW